ncbi:cyclohexanecarboxylate-CoA ligase [Xanthobacter dioxanivorans]|uniref:3-methylmercaptopropionyl-CoA ligase n=1 Tax=Xanthobacter dioxanivorans TaxID=2528964 RepID=A0A974PSM7_9HYPH|nr:cyclohexanecarboxylate-CoA ligase [Xanthobacter dioxanivorans]QRG09043.1 cyclohexanecarboxylate-CoA ligase [Xanthobacter dioxanivorans]
MSYDLLPASRRDAMTRAGLWRDETLLDHFRRHVEAHPDKTAVVATRAESGAEARFTYAELDRLSDQVAVGFLRRGVGDGDVVSFQLPNWWQFPVLHLACLKVGAVSNPLMVIFRERELTFMLGLAESKILIVPARFRNVDHRAIAAGIRADLPRLAHVFVADGEGEEDFANLIAADITDAEAAVLGGRRLSPDAVIQLLYTSGTTGEPKGVSHTSNTMLANLVPFAERLHLGPADVIHMPSPMAHQLGFMYGLVLPAMLGATAVLQDIFVAETMAQQITREGATFTMGATPFLNDLADHCLRTGTPTPTLRIFVSAGAPIPRPLVVKAREALGAAIISAWGMSENGAVTTTRVEDPQDKVTSTDGCPLPGMDVRVVDLHGKVVPAGEEGMLQVRGCSNFVGYLKRPGLAQVDQDGWFDTGDIARMDADGYIRIAGRSKDIIIRGGENIPVVEVENILFKHPAIAAVAVVGYPDPRLGERACAFVMPRAGMSITFEEMVAYLKAQKMAVQYIPERLEVVAALPQTPSGKIQKFRLREMAKAATGA